ncbi:hypothetical protein ACFLZB_01405 [Nanoarchaeota archaeon]
MIEELLSGLGVGFGVGYASVVAAKGTYRFVTRGEKSVSRFFRKIEEQMMKPDTIKKTMYLGGALSVGYLILK